MSIISLSEGSRIVSRRTGTDRPVYGLGFGAYAPEYSRRSEKTHFYLILIEITEKETLKPYGLHPWMKEPE
jgi:hypothetical protein